MLDLTGRGTGGEQNLTLSARTTEMFDQDLVLAVTVSQIGATRGSTRDILEAAGLRREETLDIITQIPVEGWFDPTVPDELRGAFANWTALARPSTLILTRASLENKHAAGEFVLRSVPPSMRLATPILVITELVADDFNLLLQEHGIAAMADNSVLVLIWDGQVRERHRTNRGAGTERSLTVAVGSALSWVGEQLDETHAVVQALLDQDEDEADDVETLRAALSASETRERALAVQLENARAETKQTNRQRWALERELELLRTPDAEPADEPTVAEAPVADDGPAPWSHLPELSESTFVSMLPRAQEVFTHLEIDGAITKAVQSLDSHPKRDIWLLRAWTTLALLDDYAADKAGGDPSGTFRAWLESKPQHPMIYLAHVRSGESAAMRGGKYGEARTFVVPTSVDPSGRAMFLTHVHIEPGKVRPNPRLHYLDDTAPGASGRIYVGHLGPHLTTRRTN